MTRQEFYAWVERQPTSRFELVEGHVQALAPERAVHARVKLNACLALRNAISRSGLPCEAFIDGLAVEVGEDTAYEPDVLVQCGDRVAANSLVAPSPVIVVEVTSPSTGRTDAVRKFRDYFRIPSVRHYMITESEPRVVLHHQREANGQIQSAILGSGALSLDPPGLTIQVEDLFEG
jgi:Uma2 family endonuclease